MANQTVNLSAILDNFAHVIEATKLAETDSGSAMRENAEYMKSYEAKVEGLSRAWQNLSTAVVKGDVLKGFIGGLADGIERIAQSQVAVDAIVTALGGLITLAGGSMLASLFAGIAPALPAILAIAAAITGISWIANASSYEAALKATEEQKAGIEAINKEYESIQAEYDVLNSKAEKLTEYEKGRKDYLEDILTSGEKENKLAEANLELTKAQSKEFKKYSKDLYKETKGMYDAISGDYITNVQREFTALQSNIQEHKYSVNEATKAIDDYRNAWKPTIDKLKEYQSAGAELDKWQLDMIQTWNEFEQMSNDFVEANKTVIDSTIDVTNALEKQADITVSLRNRYAELDAVLSNLGKEASGADRINALQEAYKAMLEDFKAGKWGTPAVQDWINNFVPEGVKEALGYDMEAIAKYAAGETVNGFHSELSALMETQDPMAAFIQMIEDAGGSIQDASGKTAAYINDQGQLIIDSWGGVAEAIGTTDAGVQAFRAGLQDYNANVLLSTEEISNVYTALGTTIEEATPEEIATAIKLTFRDATPEELANIAAQIVADTTIPPAEVVAELNTQSLIDAENAITEGADGTTGQATIETSADDDSLTAAEAEIENSAAGLSPNVEITTSVLTTETKEAIEAFVANPQSYTFGSDFDPQVAEWKIDELIAEAEDEKISLGAEISPEEEAAIEARLEKLTKAREIIINVKTNKDVIDDFNDSLDSIADAPKKFRAEGDWLHLGFAQQFANMSTVLKQTADGMNDVVVGATQYGIAFDKIIAANENASLSGDTVVEMIDSFRSTFGPWVDQINAFGEAKGIDAITPQMQSLLDMMTQLDGLKIKADDIELPDPLIPEGEEPTLGVNGEVNEVTIPEGAEPPKVEVEGEVHQITKDPSLDGMEAPDLEPFDITADNSQAKESVEEISNEVEELKSEAETPAIVVIGADEAKLQESIDKLQEFLDRKEEIPETKSMTVNAHTEEASAALSEVVGYIGSIQDKSVTISVTTIYSTVGSPMGSIPGRAEGVKNSPAGLALVNDGAPVNGSSAELIVQDGQAFIAGDGEETILPLKQGATVYTAKETQDILRNSNNRGIGTLLNTGVNAYATGTPTDISKIKSGVAVGSGSVPSAVPKSSSKSSSSSSSSKDKHKKEFENWLKERKHFLAMDLITEKEYYDSLEEMYKQYFSDLSKYQEEYWKYEEEVYKYRKQELEDTIKLENSLNELAKAKTQKVLVYKDGKFQYIQNVEAIAKAQQEVNAIQGYADGTTNAKAGLDLVGENGPELRVLNHDGIIPADITRNLLRLGSMSVGSLGEFGSNSTDIFNIERVVLENVNNVEDIFSGLKNLALQRATSRI